LERRICFKTNNKIKKSGISVKYHNGESIYFANQKKCDLFLSPHCDGSTNPNYRGWLIDGQNGNWFNEQTRFETLFQKNYTPPIPNSQNHINANTSYFFGYSYISAPAKILIKFGTMTNPDDIKFLIENQNFCVEKTFQNNFRIF